MEQLSVRNRSGAPTILIYFEAPGSDELLASYVFTALAHDGMIAQHGAFDYIQDGTSYDADKAMFGAKAVADGE